MPVRIHPMLAEAVEKPFDGAEWLFEIKWDGYRAIAFIDGGKVRLVSRNQNDLTPRYPELKDMARFIQAKTAILDGEVVALDEEGKASFSLMQQRTGFRPGGKRAAANADVPVLYYAFDLLYLDGYDWRRVPLEERKRKLASLVVTGDVVRYSDHYEERGKALFEMARQKGLEGIVAKKRASFYEERRSREWLKIKIRHRLECVVGGYTEPEGSRAHFGSLVLGLYDKQGRLIHVGQAGSGFDQKSLDEIWKVLKKLETKKNPFFGEVEALRKVFWVKPELVAEIEFAEWTDGRNSSQFPPGSQSRGDGEWTETPCSGVSRIAGRQRSERVPAGESWAQSTVTENRELRTLLFYVLHGQQRAVVVAAGIDGAGDHAGESVAHFGILRD